jgi:hypothetical protein
MVYIVAIVFGIVGLFDNGMKGFYLFGAAPFGYRAISYIERNVLYITTLDNYFWWKLILKPLASLFVGPFAAPVFIIKDLIGIFTANKQPTE